MTHKYNSNTRNGFVAHKLVGLEVLHQSLCYIGQNLGIPQIQDVILAAILDLASRWPHPPPTTHPPPHPQTQPQIQPYTPKYFIYNFDKMTAFTEKERVWLLKLWNKSQYWNKSITVTSQWARWRLKSTASQLFTHPFVQAQIKKSITAPRHWPLWREFTGDWWIPLTKGQWALQWRHNERDGVYNQRRLNCLLIRLFRHRSKKTSQLRVTGLCGENSTVIGEFPLQRACDMEQLPFDYVIMKKIFMTISPEE